METKRTRWTSQTKFVVSLALLMLGVYLIFRFSVVIPPFILSVILAYILAPYVERVKNRLRIPGGIATLIVFLGFLLVIALLLFIVASPLARQLMRLTVDSHRILEQVETIMSYQITIAGQVVIDGADLFDQLSGTLQRLLEPFFERSLSIAVNVISSLVWIIFILVISFYLIKDGPALRQWLDRIIPADYRHDFHLLRDEINIVWSDFFRGQLLLALVVALIFTTIGFILGLPLALPLGLMAGLLEFLPSIGHGIWLFTASIVAYAVGSTWIPVPNWVFVLILIGLHLVFQQFDLNYLIPRIIGRRVRLPPIVVILGIVAGAAMAGVLGVVLAAPTIATTRILGRYVYANLFDLDPFPEVSISPLPPPDPKWWRVRSTSKTQPPPIMKSE